MNLITSENALHIKWKFPPFSKTCPPSSPFLEGGESHRYTHESMPKDTKRKVTLASVVPKLDLWGNSASVECVWAIPFMLAIVLWALFESDSEILFSLTRANPILGAFVLPFRLLRHLNGPPLTGLFYWAPFISTHFPASLISEAPVGFYIFFFFLGAGCPSQMVFLLMPLPWW